MDKEKLIQIFYDLLYVRMVEERVCDLYSEQHMRCPVHISIGQEATAVGVSHTLIAGDKAFSNHRSHGHYLAKGGDLNKFFAELYGKATGCARGRGGSMHLVDLSCGFIGATPIVSSTVPVALGAAFALAQRPNNKNIAVIYLGDATMEEGVVHETLNYAKLKNLPLLFVCENNFYSVYTHLRERQPDRPISNIPRAHGLACYTADGNDAVAVHETALRATEEIRAGGGPAFIELVTYRWREHCGPNYDNNIGYRTEEEFLAWKEKDPVKIMQERLITQKIITPSDVETLMKHINARIDTAVTFAKESPFPDKKELDLWVYAT